MRRQRAWKIGLLAASLWTATQGVDAAPPAELTTLLDQAIAQRAPLPADAVERTWSELLVAIEGIETHLNAATPQVRDGWLAYLQLDDLRTLSKDRSATQQLETLDQLWRRMTVDRPGLEEAPMLRLRSASRKYANALRLSALDVPAETSKRLEQLRGLLAKYSEKPDRATADQIGKTLAWLDSAGQASPLVAAIRQHWSQPNFVIQIHEQFANAYAKKDVEQVSNQTTNILGTVTHGPAETKAKLAVDFRPNDKQAELWLQLRGEIHANQNIGHNGPATIYSASVTDFTANKPIVIDPRLGVAGLPAFATADTDAQVRHIHVDPKHFKNLLDGPFTKAAWKKSHKIHGAAEQEASRIAANRVAQGLEEQSITPLTTGQKAIEHFLFVGPLRTHEMPVLSSRSTDDLLQLQLKVAAPNQLGSPSGLPKLDAHAPIVAAMHDSFLSNLSARYVFQGATHDDETIEKLAKMLAGEVPIPLRVFSNSPFWSVTLESDHPMTVAFDNGQVDLTVHTKSWKLEERVYACPVNIHVHYGLEATKFGVRFIRQGEVEVAAAPGHKLTDDERTKLMPHVEQKARAMFPATGRFNNLIMPDGGTFGPIGDLRLKTLSCDDGWLMFEYK